MQGMKIWHLEKDPGEVLRSGRIDKQLNTVIFSPDMRQILTGGQAWDVNKKNKKYNSKPSSLRIFWNILNMLTICWHGLEICLNPKMWSLLQALCPMAVLCRWHPHWSLEHTCRNQIYPGRLDRQWLDRPKASWVSASVPVSRTRLRWFAGGAPGMVINLSKLSFNIQHWHALALYPLPAVANLLWRWKHFDILRCSFCRSWGKIVTPDMTC